ncbi:MAG: 50S ribosomal protein L13 [bacterium]|nr:50S ribosomal protein L13 [bacterium]
MEEKIERKTYTIDANGKILGRLASKIAVLLMGKNKPSFIKNKDMGDFVIVKNVSKIRFTGNKIKKKIFYRHTGYIGSLKKITLGKAFEENPAKVLRASIFGMLPKNRQRKERLRRLKIEL